MSKQKVLVTGSGGFIASNFIRYAIYNRAPYGFTSIDKIKKHEVIKNVYSNKGHAFYIGDICDKHFINIIFEIERPDIVIHMAAESHVDSSIDDAVTFINSNILGTQIIIDACLNWGVQRLIYTSTDKVYGQLATEQDSSWIETSSLNPRNPYAASKLAAEYLIKAAAETHGLKYNITRSCNNYGPRQSIDKFIPKIIKCILNDQEIPIYGQGAQIRDWLYVEDNCRALLKILESGEENQIYNISAGQEFSNIEVVQKICNILEKGHNLIKFVNDRKGHDFRYSVESGKLRALGWNPEVKFKDGIILNTQWFLNNRWALK